MIFALTHHGGHLGYFEGGIVRPNSVTWLDRVIVEFGTALLLHHKNSADQQQLPTYTTSSSCLNCEPSVNISALVNDDYDDDDDVDDDVIEPQQRDINRSASPPQASAEADTENQLAADVVAEILRVSASVVCNDTSSVRQRGSRALANNDDAFVMTSANINHSVM